MAPLVSMLENAKSVRRQSKTLLLLKQLVKDCYFKHLLIVDFAERLSQSLKDIIVASSQNSPLAAQIFAACFPHLITSMAEKISHFHDSYAVESLLAMAKIQPSIMQILLTSAKKTKLTHAVLALQYYHSSPWLESCSAEICEIGMQSFVCFL